MRDTIDALIADGFTARDRRGPVLLWSASRDLPGAVLWVLARKAGDLRVMVDGEHGERITLDCAPRDLADTIALASAMWAVVRGAP